MLSCYLQPANNRWTPSSMWLDAAPQIQRIGGSLHVLGNGATSSYEYASCLLLRPARIFLHGSCPGHVASTKIHGKVVHTTLLQGRVSRRQLLLL